MGLKNEVKSLLTVIIAVGLILSLLLPLLASTVNAGGIGLAPRKIIVHDALRGSEYERTIMVFNICNTTLTLSLNASGDAGSWISFYEEDNPNTPTETITIEDENATLLLKIKVPEDATNGAHNASILLKSVPTTGGTGSGVVFGINADVSVEVTGTQILTGIVKYITTRDTEVNYPLRTQVMFQNTGNVIANPEIKTVITKDGAFVDSFIYADTEIKPGITDTISREWDTTGMESGDYVANVTISLDGEILAEQERPFKLLPIGTLSRQGDLTEISYEGLPLVGTTVKILATFVNTGEIDTRAKFIGEVYVDGNLIDTISSEELLVPVRETETLTAYLKIEKGSSYVIKGQALYEGKTTETKELSFDVGTEPESKPSIPGFGIIETIASTVVAIALIILFVRKRKRK